MARAPKILQARFYHTPGGAEPVREWLKGLDEEDRRQIGIDIRKVEFGWPIGMPTCKPLGRGLWEVRTDLCSNRIARVIFAISDGEMGLLHGFIKKTRKTPDDDLKLALKRKKEMEP
ncbi:MAG: type II toxin-antitoxin system RelE/ParE family toxin [Alphaproteobacteria bacterium]|nr:MAG: type II toxin-antitoxin system RelE/ParE family toxin [Alphaproteobacteria bacterium]